MYKVVVSKVVLQPREESWHASLGEALAQIAKLAQEWGLGEPKHIEACYCPQTGEWLVLEATRVPEEETS